MRVSLETDPIATVKSLFEGVVYMHGEEMPFRYVVWIDGEILLEEFYLRSPWIIARWSKINTETQGRGPALDALPSIISLNEIARLEFVSANMNISRPIMAFSDGVFNPNTFKMTANTVIPIARSSDGIFPLQPFPDVANPQLAQMTAMDLRQQINSLFFTSPLGEINDNPAKTATEMTIRQKSLAEEIGPSFTRLQQEYLGPALQTVIDILQELGIIEKLEIDGKIIQARYKSPLVLAQGEQDIDNFMDYCQKLLAIFGEAGLSVINPVTTPGWMATKKGIESSLYLDQDQIKTMLQAQQQQQQEMQQAEMASMQPQQQPMQQQM
jgi:hypothetical protein